MQAEFRDRVRVFRKKKGFSQTDLAKKLGISQTAASHYESTRYEVPRKATVMKLAKALGVNRYELQEGFIPNHNYLCLYRNCQEMATWLVNSGDVINYSCTKHTRHFHNGKNLNCLRSFTKEKCIDDFLDELDEIRA